MPSAGVACVFLLQLLLGSGADESIGGQESSYDVPASGYELRVYELSHARRTSSSMSTLFSFDSEDLPFEFDSLKFGDFRADIGCSSSYYGGLGLLVGANGSEASVILREGYGKFIYEVLYLGQSTIVVGGWESVSHNDDGEVIEHSCGAMAIAAHDWKDGCWTPENGILIEHPGNVTVATAILCLMVFEPSANTSIPEFGFLPAIFAVAVMILLVRRRRMRQESQGIC